MRPKEHKLIITFPSTIQALALEAASRKAGMPGRLIPVPREVSAGCGLAWCAGPEERGNLEQLIRERGLTVERLYELFI